jgi:hypothetical protein
MSETTTPTQPATTATPPAPVPTGAAVVPDLYRVPADPVKEKAHLREEARKMGLLFFAFFSLFIGGVSLIIINGALKRGWVIEVTPPAGVEAKAFAVESAAGWRVRWSNDQVSDVAVLERFDEHAPKGAGPTFDQMRALARVRVQAVDEKGARHDVAALWTPAPAPGARVLSVEVPGVGPAHAEASFPHALRTARLAKVVPTHCAVSLGAIFGLLGALLPGVLAPFYVFWMKYVAAPMGYVNTRLILGLVFFVLFTPAALFLAVRRLFGGSDALDRADHPGSYWKTRAAQRPPRHFERTF